MIIGAMAAMAVPPQIAAPDEIKNAKRFSILRILPINNPAKKGEIATRQNGVLVSMINGKTLAYALFNLQSRGRMFVGHGLEVYKGQIVGLHSRDNDLPVNPTKAKQLTNIRAAGTDENLILTPHIQHTLEQALEFIEDDELVEITPESIRLRKKIIR